jgi:hypothetical protein
LQKQGENWLTNSVFSFFASGNIGAKRSSNDKKLLGIIFGSVIFIAMLAIGLILYIRKKKGKS